MKIGIIGLGRMGGSIAKMLHQVHADAFVYDIDPAKQQEYRNLGIPVMKSIEDLSAQAECIWVMVSAHAVDRVLDNLCDCILKDTVIIDGGNSHYTDTKRRAAELKKRDVKFLDCGTSGGLWGAENGFSMTIGGEYEYYKKVEEVFKILAYSSQSYLYVGPSGAGHYVKMVHNGIEYALLEAYGEGFSLLENNKEYPSLDLAAISNTWLNGAVIRSWILQLTHKVLVHDQRLENINGAVGENGTGRWTVEEAHKEKIRVTLIEDAVNIRKESRLTGGDYATKLVALMRHEMGGHPITQAECEKCLHVRED